jgi:hypothetical protein
MGEQIAQILHRHLSGDWGEVDRQDAAGALTHGERLLSAYDVNDTGPTNHVVKNVSNGPCGNGCHLLIAVDPPARSVLRGEGSARRRGCN